MIFFQYQKKLTEIQQKLNKFRRDEITIKKDTYEDFISLHLMLRLKTRQNIIRRESKVLKRYVSRRLPL